MEAWLLASDSKCTIDSRPDDSDIRDATVKLATATGFFSIRITVFEGDEDMLVRLIERFPGTRESGCFGVADGRPVSPAPNPDALTGGGKI